MITVSLINLGCPKNLVDSEIMLGLVKKSGIEICKKPESADIMCINTCAFIKEAKEESIDAILELVNFKKQDPRKKIIVIGCLVQRYLKELQKEIPEVDRWVPIQNISKLPEIIRELKHKEVKVRAEGSTLVPTHVGTSTAEVVLNSVEDCVKPVSPGMPQQKVGTAKSLPGALAAVKNKIPSKRYEYLLYDTNPPRQILTTKFYTYLKIAEGCSNRCSYCVIPDIRGNYRSRNPDSILREAKTLAKKRFKEINLIAQDTTNYGSDLPRTTNITLLLKELCKIKEIKWIRLLYTHPAHITDPLLKEIASQKKICKYMDIPLQHIDNEILSKMKRKINSQNIKNLIKKIRKEIPGVTLRTSFIVGFPGETEKQFHSLLKFIKEIKFEKLGIFKYSREEGTPAYKMPHQIPKSVKEKRYHEAMRIQQGISKKVNKKFIGKTMDALIEEIHDKKSNIWIGRTYTDAPDIDGVTYISGKDIKKGDIIKVKITGAMDYDLIGKKQ